MKQFNRIVVKVGTSTLTHSTGKANIKAMSELVEVLSDLMNSGKEVVLVTSGAISIGLGKMGIAKRPEDTPRRQAAATVGQCELMFMYDKLFSEYDHVVGQLLITKSDVDDPERRNNMINTFQKLFEYGVIPIVNENDSVAVEEIVYGDNDSLSATVAKLIKADLLIILTDVDGLYRGNPSEDKNAELIPVVESITPEIERLAGGIGSSRGTGGMATKIIAAKIATEAGIDTIVMSGANSKTIYDVVEGKQAGTIFRGK